MDSKFVFLLFVVIGRNQGHIYNKCTLARKFLELEVPLADIPVWVCLSNSTSRLNSKFHNHTAWGIFGVNSNYWCDVNTTLAVPVNPCKVTCQETIQYVSRAVWCGLMIKKIQGWVAWGKHYDECRNYDIEYLESCYEFMTLYRVASSYGE